MLRRFKAFYRLRPALRPAGLFVTHVDTPRVRAHFNRLCRETAGFIDWHFLYNDGNRPAPRWDVKTRSPEDMMPARFRQMVKNEGIMNGHQDPLIIPCVLALGRRYVWVMEYDVDFAGPWGDFFGLYRDDQTDLLTTTLTTPTIEPDWHHWSTARYPADLRPAQMRRDFHPIMRLSRRFAETYCAAMCDDSWGGHWEFLFATVAEYHGLSVRDLQYGGARHGIGPTYTNTPNDLRLLPGTFVWRPFRDAYFHEKPDDFAEIGRLYHPIKTDDPGWDQAFNVRRATAQGNA